MAGLCWECRILPVKVLDASGQGYWSDFLEGVDWARTHGASVVNLSLGSGLSAAQRHRFWQQCATARADELAATLEDVATQYFGIAVKICSAVMPDAPARCTAMWIPPLSIVCAPM